MRLMLTAHAVMIGFTYFPWVFHEISAGEPGSAQHGGDGGVVAVEYAAVLVVGALILGALVALGIQAKVADGTGTAICRIVHPRGGCTEAGAVGGPTDRTDGNKDGHKPHGSGENADGSSQDDECHGFWGCTGSVFQQIGSGFYNVGKGFVDDVVGLYNLVRNPSAIVDAGKYIWNHPGDAARQLVWDDETAKMWADGDYGGAIGRTVWNVGSWVIPGYDIAKGFEKAGKFGKLGRAADKVTKAAGDGAKAGKASKALKGIWAKLKKARKSRKDGTSISKADLYRLGVAYKGLNKADRAKFLENLSDQELRDFYHANKPLRDDILADASAKDLEILDPPNPEFANAGGWKPFKGDLYNNGGPAVRDITQGQLGDCWCMGAMGAIARQNPDLIKDMIKKNPNGTYTVTLHDGHRVTVTADLPVKGARVSEKAGWPAILEKAVAKRMGGYDRIGEGEIADRALRMLTGKSTRDYSSSNMRDLGSLSMDFQSGDAMVVSLGSGVKLKNLKDRGIVRGHSYAVVDVDKAEGTVTLANPHGPTSKKVVLTEDELRSTKGLSLFQTKTR